MNHLILYGNEAVAREAFYCFREFSDYVVAGFTVDQEFIRETHFCGMPLVPFECVAEVYSPDKYSMFISVGYVNNNKIRADRYAKSRVLGYTFVNFVSPRATVYADVDIGVNCFIGHNSAISPNAVIGNNVIIGNGCNIGHDTTISEHCFISNDVSVSGGVTIGAYCYLGTNATIRNKVAIGRECVVGAGAVILENIADRSVLMAEPARVLPISSNKLSLG